MNRLQPTHDGQPPVVALVETPGSETVVPERCRAHGHGDIEGLANFETREPGRRHTDDGERLIQKRERASDDGLPTAKIRLPERVTHNRRSGAASAMIVVGVEEAAPLGWDAEHPEEVATHPEAARSPRLAAAASKE